MDALKAKKTMKYKKSRWLDEECYFPTIVSLSRDMLMEILVRVASASCTDLFNAKSTCKDLLEVADQEDSIFRHVSLEKFSVIPWNINNISFLECCKDCGNLEFPYRQRMVSYFSHRMIELGFEYLRKAAEKEHIEATYVYGIILLCSRDQDDESRQQDGIKILSSMKNKLGSLRMRECRDRVKMVFYRGMWWNKNNSFGKPITLCSHEDQPCMHKLQQIRMNGWLSFDELVDEYDDILCESCRCNCETTWFYNIQHGIGY